MTSPSEVPIALFIHARPRETEQVLGAIRRYEPRTLYVVADGPRLGVSGESERCLEARAVVGSVDWECDVRWLRRDTNFGSGRSVKEGLDWVFSQEERAIILEDDTVPDRSFFSYCEELLVLYEDIHQVGMISGNNLIDFTPPGGTSYFFSQIPTTWGWATWRRAWTHNDFYLGWMKSRGGRETRRISLNRRHFYYWRWAFRLIQKGRVDAWDWQWNASLARRGQLTVVPSANLVRNVGFGEGATHTFRLPRGMKPETSTISFPMVHPRTVARCKDYETKLISQFLPDRRPEVLAGKTLVNWFVPRVFDSFYRRFVRPGH